MEVIVKKLLFLTLLLSYFLPLFGMDLGEPSSAEKQVGYVLEETDQVITEPIKILTADGKKLSISPAELQKLDSKYIQTNLQWNLRNHQELVIDLKEKTTSKTLKILFQLLNARNKTFFLKNLSEENLQNILEALDFLIADKKLIRKAVQVDVQKKHMRNAWKDYDGTNFYTNLGPYITDMLEVELQKISRRSPHVIANHPAAKTSFQISPDSRIMVTLYSHHPDTKYTVETWDIHTGILLYTFEYDGSIATMVISPDSRFIVIGSNNTAQIRDAQTGTLLHTLPEHENWINSIAIAFHDDDIFIITGSRDAIRIWDFYTGTLLHTLRCPGGIESTIISPDTNLIIAKTDHRTVYAWDIHGNRKYILSTQDGVKSVTIAPNSNFIVTTFTRGPVRIWNAQTGALLHTLPENTLNMDWKVAISPDSNFIIRLKTGIPEIWDPHSGQILHTLRPLFDANALRTQFRISPDSNFIILIPGIFAITQSINETVEKWNTHTGNRQYTLDVSRPIGGIRISPDNKLIITISNDAFADCNMQIWNAQTGTLLHTFERYEGDRILSPEFSPDNSCIITRTPKNNIYIWNTIWTTLEQDASIQKILLILKLESSKNKIELEKEPMALQEIYYSLSEETKQKFNTWNNYLPPKKSIAHKIYQTLKNPKVSIPIALVGLGAYFGYKWMNSK